MPGLERFVASLIWKAGLARDLQAAKELTEDIVQEVAERALGLADQFNPDLSGHAWLNQIALNILYEQRRRIYRERRMGIAPDSVAGRSSGEPKEDPLELVPDNRGFDELALHDLLELAPSADREILRARYIIGSTPEEIAQQCSISLGAVYVRLSRARIRLREALGSSNGSREEG
jgi:RNA polymerase sigma-70 factor, ECF subfamily